MKRKSTNCEECVHFDFNEETESYECTQDLDEDELIRFLKGDNMSCPYFRYYDEYKFVQKQN